MSDVESMDLDKPEPFPLLYKKLLTHDVNLISCCPTTDLILLVSTKNEMKLYRNGTDLQWTISEDNIGSPIKVLAWHPNGKEFVAGCEDGSLYNINVRYASPKITECQLPDTGTGTEPASITSLRWIQYIYKGKEMYIEGFDSNAFDIESNLPLLNEESPQPPKTRTRMLQLGRKKSILPLKPEVDKDDQSLLLVGNSHGQLQLLLNGKYSIAQYSVDNGATETIYDVCVRHDASIVQLLTASKNDQQNLPKLQKLDTRYLKKRKPEISKIAEVQMQLDYLLKYITACVDVLKKHHDHYTHLSKSMVGKLRDCILETEETVTAMPAMEFYGPLATGMVTEPLQEFLTNYMSLTSIKQWEEDASYGYKHSIITTSQYILPACDRILLYLSKYLGYSSWRQRYGDLLNKVEVEICMEIVREFIGVMYEFKNSMQAQTKGFKPFIAWLSTLYKKVTRSETEEAESDDPEDYTCEEPGLVFDYLNTGFEQDPFEMYFESLKDRTESDKNMVKLVNRLTECCKRVLNKPSEAISFNIKHMSTVPLTGLPSPALSSNCKLTSHISLDDTIHYSISEKLQKSKVILLKNKIKEDTVKYFSFLVKGEVTDSALFDENELGVLTQVDKENTYLHSYALKEVNHRAYDENSRTSIVQPSRTQKLMNMTQVKLGCNGLKRRRLVCLVPYNKMLQLHSMDAEDDDED